MKRKDLTGKRFGRYTVVEYVGTKYDKNGGNAKARWKCQCDCGNIRIVDSASLLLGRSKSCGCLCREINSQRMKKMIKDNGCYITRLQEQLNEANKTIHNIAILMACDPKDMTDIDDVFCPEQMALDYCNEYQKKWKV